jgi:hypothetical protein
MSIWFWLLVFVFFPFIVSAVVALFVFACVSLVSVGMVGTIVVGAMWDGVTRWRY